MVRDQIGHTFSIIFHGFAGDNRERLRAFELTFGERGAYMSLASNSAKYAPCELAADLDRNDAERRVQILNDAGIVAEIVPTADVVGVKHIASEFWPTHRASNGQTFTERDGVVVRGASLDLSAQISQTQKSAPAFSPWAFELAYNHEHPSNCLDRYSLRKARRRGAEIAVALVECLPDRRFLIVYRDEQISFCQFTDQLPIGISSKTKTNEDNRISRSASDTSFCEVCEGATAYTSRAEPDTEFPHAQFGDCVVCGNEVILWADQDIVLASASAAAKTLVPNPSVDAWERTPSQEALPHTFEALHSSVAEILHPIPAWIRSACRLWLGCERESMSEEEQFAARNLLQIDELTALLFAYRLHQLGLPHESQDRSTLTPERLGIGRSSLFYHPVRRALAPVTVATLLDDSGTNHMLINGTDEKYAAGRRIEPNRPIYEGRFGYGFLDTKGRQIWLTGRDGATRLMFNDIAPHAAKPWTASMYGAGKSLNAVGEHGEHRSIAYTTLMDDDGRVIAQHRRLFRRFFELDIEPNPSIILNRADGVLTLQSDAFVWGVILGRRTSATLPDNAFDLLPGVPYSINWDADAHGEPVVRFTGNKLLGHVGALLS